MIRSTLSLYGIKQADVLELPVKTFNKHYRVKTEEFLYCLRLHSRPISTQNLNYEAELLDYLLKSGISYIPKIVRALDGKNYVWKQNQAWTLFEWSSPSVLNDPICITKKHRENAAEALADIHRVGMHWPPNNNRPHAPLFTGPELWGFHYLETAQKIAFYFRSKGGDRLLRYTQQVIQELENVPFNNLQFTICHADYKPSNILFLRNEIKTIYDFDCSFKTFRLLDLAGAVTRFQISRGLPTADVVSGREFLLAYSNCYPLNRIEVDYLPTFIRWRLIRDVVMCWSYRPQFWHSIELTCEKLFEGIADRICEVL